MFGFGFGLENGIFFACFGLILTVTELKIEFSSLLSDEFECCLLLKGSMLFDVDNQLLDSAVTLPFMVSEGYIVDTILSILFFDLRKDWIAHITQQDSFINKYYFEIKHITSHKYYIFPSLIVFNLKKQLKFCNHRHFTKTFKHD